MNRRSFLKNTGAAIVLSTQASVGTNVSADAENLFPRYRGFNLLDYFAPQLPPPDKTTSDEHLKWIRDWGFDFIRLPMAYPSYVQFDRSRPIKPEEVYQINNSAVDQIESLVRKAHQAGLHVSLNLHRAPGYCINAGFREPYNLWRDSEAQEAFYFHWNFWANRFRDVDRSKISFDLLNEPSLREDMNDQHTRHGTVPGELYRRIARGAMEAIRKENPHHLIIADGNNVGTTVIKEIADLDIVQSCRGYHPGIISHYKAPWAFKEIDNLPEPKWPGQVGNQLLNREMLEKFYQPWIALKNQGVGVHCGECGCWNKTPHAVFLNWFSDLLDILTQNQIGYALWEFNGSFGLLNSGRTDVAYEDWYGYKLDKKLLELLQKF